MNNQLASYTCILQSEKGFLSLNRSEDSWDDDFSSFRELRLRQQFFELGNICSQSADLESNTLWFSLSVNWRVILKYTVEQADGIVCVCGLHKASVDWDPWSILHWKRDFSISTFNSTWSQEKTAVYEEDLSYCFHCCNTAWLLTREFSVMFTSSIKFVLWYSCRVLLEMFGYVDQRSKICAGGSVGSWSNRIWT